MDLDEDPSAAPAPSSGTATPQSSKGAKTVSGLANVPKSGAAASGKEAQPKSSLSTSANEPAAPPVADLEPPSSKPTAPLTTSKKVAAAAAKVQSKGKKAPGPVKPVPPNLVLPSE